VNKPGDYFLTCLLYDTSTNTAAAGPKHTASDPITVKFTTTLDLGVTRYARNLTNSIETLVFKQGALTNLFLDSSTNLTLPSGGWASIAGPFASAPAFNGATTLSITNTNYAARFYRLRGVAP
jgi:hypothetical protein